MTSSFKNIFSVSLGCALLILLTPNFANNVTTTSPNSSIAPMLQKVLPSVVQITVDVKPEPDQTEPHANPMPAPNTPPASPVPPSAGDMGSLGTGIIIDAKNGIIVTNAHVIKNAKQIFVTLKNGNRYYGNVVAMEPNMDIAVLHIDAKNLKAMPMASMKNVRVGDYVAAVGSPFGLTQTVTTGTISALNRAQPFIADLNDFIQTDASINPGNSGGPLVNTQGQMVGMNTALIGPTAASIGLGFAIPVDIVQSIAHQLIKYGNIKQGMLGIVVQPLNQSLAQALNNTNQHGSLVTQIIPGSAAAKAGIHPTDIISSINGVPIKTAFDLKTQVGLNRPGAKVSIAYWHQDKKHTVKATLQSMQETLSHTVAMPFVAGIQLQNLNALSSEGDSVKGLLVTDVKAHSQGLLADIEPGDVIVALNGQASESLAQMRQILTNVPQKQQQLLVKLYRDGKFIYTTLGR